MLQPERPVDGFAFNSGSRNEDIMAKSLLISYSPNISLGLDNASLGKYEV